MSFRAMLTQTATVVHHPPTGSDAEGNSTFGTPTTTDYPALLQQIQGSLNRVQMTSSERVIGEARSDTGFILFLPPEAAGETFEDEVLVNGLRYQVEGQPAVTRSPRGVHHVETRLRRISP